MYSSVALLNASFAKRGIDITFIQHSVEILIIQPFDCNLNLNEN